VNSEERFRKWHGRLQPGRNDLLINGEWGEPLENHSKAEAGEKGLTAWNHRWVGDFELRLLKPQYRAYRRIKTIAALIACIGFYMLTHAPEKIEQVQAGIRGLVAAGAAGAVLLYPFFHFAVAWGIGKYKNAARWIAIVLYPLLIPPRTFYAHQTSEINTWRMIVLAFFIYILVGFFSKTARVIFATNSLKRSDAADAQEAEASGDGKTA